MFRSGKSLVLAYLFYFIVVAVLGGFIFSSFKSSPTPKPPVHHQTARPPTRQATPQPSTPQQSPPAPGNNSLTDSGPGDMAGLFVAASIAGAGLYRYLLLRRLTPSE